MEIKIKELYQWDLDVTVEIVSGDIDEVNFKNPYGDTAFVMPITRTDSGVLANIPNILLQYTHDIHMYVVKSDQTWSDRVFKITPRQRPSDYVYTETEILSLKQLEEELKEHITEELEGVVEEVSKVGQEILDDLQAQKVSITDEITEEINRVKDESISEIQRQEESIISSITEEVEIKTSDSISTIQNEEKVAIGHIQETGNAQSKDIVNVASGAKSDIEKKRDESVDSVIAAKTDALQIIDTTKEEAVAEIEGMIDTKAGAIVLSAVGKTILTTDSANAPIVNLQAQGESEQKQYEGHQLFDVSRIRKTTDNGITASIDGTVLTLSGTNTNTAYLEFDLPKTIPTGTQVTFKVYNGSANSNVAIRLNSNGVSDGVTYFTIDKANKNTTVTLSKDCDSLCILVSPTTINMLFSIMLSENADAELEPYVGNAPSPSMEYPQEVENLENVEVKVLSGNLLNLANLVGKKYEVLEASTGSIRLNYVENEYYAVIVLHSQELIDILLNHIGKSITVACNNIPNYHIGFVIWGSRKDGRKYQEVTSKKGTNTLSFTIEEFNNIEYCELRIGDYTSTSRDTTTIINGLRLYLGDEYQPFTPYKEPQTLTIPYVLREGDKVEYAKAEKTENSGEYVFTGQEYCYQWGGGKAICVQVPMRFAKNEGYCTHYINRTLDEVYEGLKTGFYFHYQDGPICFYDENYDATSFKTMLAEKYAEGKPIKICGILAEPIITDLTEAELEAYKQLHTNYPTTTILSNAELEVEYVADTKNYVDKQIAIAVASTQALILEN